MRILESDFYRNHGYRDGIEYQNDFQYSDNTKTSINLNNLSKDAEAKLSKNIQSWYKKTFPSDVIWEDINPEFTFMDMLKALLGKDKESHNIYDYCGDDSIVRERVFMYVSDATEASYEVVSDSLC